jgi:adenosylmethionine-8-amino-7-oxononanoate aminotransferase
MITDDVASGWGKLKAYHPYTTAGYGIQPDISALGKSLTAGYTPLGAAVCNQKVGDVISAKGAWNYNHTWQPSMMGIYIMLNVYDYIEKHKLMEQAHVIESKLRDLGDHFKRVGIVSDSRASGLFLSLDAKKETAHTGLSSRFLRNNIRVCAPLIADNYYFNELEGYIHNAST